MSKKFTVALFALISFIAPQIIFATTSSISKLVFTTESITVAPGELSGQLTVQLQNSSGAGEESSETMDVTFTSTSATGEFSNSSGSAVTKTMSTGTANKNFFYRDSNNGTPTLTVSVVGRSTGATFTASQVITVGSNSSGSGGAVAGTSTSQTNNQSSSSQSSQTYGTTDSIKPKVQAWLSIHGPSNVYVNTPVYYYVSTQNALGVPDLIWSFGDGAASHSEGVWHAYNLEGAYVVLVKAPSLGPNVTARQTIYVSRPSLALRSATVGREGAIRVGNLSNNEIDISGYSIWSGERLFVFPEGTMLLPDSDVPFANKLTGLDKFVDSVELRTPDGSVIDRIVLSNDTQPIKLIQATQPEQTSKSVTVTKISPAVLLVASSTNNKKVIVIARKTSIWSKIISFPKLMISSVIGAL